MLGEGPMWHPAENALYWVDCSGKMIHRLDPDAGRAQRRAAVHAGPDVGGDLPPQRRVHQRRRQAVVPLRRRTDSRQHHASL